MLFLPGPAWLLLSTITRRLIYSLYCTFVVRTGGCRVALKLNLCLGDYPQVWRRARERTDEKRVSRARARVPSDANAKLSISKMAG